MFGIYSKTTNMRDMKKLLTLFALLVCCMSVSAKSVVFRLSDNTLVYYLLGGETNPVLKFEGNGFTVNSDQYEFSGVKNFYISDEDDPAIVGIDEIKTAAPKYDGNTLVIASENAAIKVLDVSGKEVKAAISSADGRTSVDMSSLPKGVYIINTGKSSMKVMKR